MKKGMYNSKKAHTTQPSPTSKPTPPSQSIVDAFCATLDYSDALAHSKAKSRSAQKYRVTGRK